MSETKSSSYSIGNLLYTIACACTAMIGYSIHKSILWSIVDFILCPFVWIKWMIYKEVTLDIIKKTFEWFF